MLTHQHKTTNEQVTLLETLNVYNGLGIKHYRLKRENGREITIPFGEFENNYVKILTNSL